MIKPSQNAATKRSTPHLHVDCRVSRGRSSTDSHHFSRLACIHDRTGAFRHFSEEVDGALRATAGEPSTHEQRVRAPNESVINAEGSVLAAADKELRTTDPASEWADEELDSV